MKVDTATIQTSDDFTAISELGDQSNLPPVVISLRPSTDPTDVAAIQQEDSIPSNNSIIIQRLTAQVERLETTTRMLQNRVERHELASQTKEDAMVQALQAITTKLSTMEENEASRCAPDRNEHDSLRGQLCHFFDRSMGVPCTHACFTGSNYCVLHKEDSVNRGGGGGGGGGVQRKGKGKAAAEDKSVASTMLIPQCRHTSRRGERCRNQARQNEKYCGLHVKSKTAEPVFLPGKCQAVTKKGGQCLDAPVKGSPYCLNHLFRASINRKFN